MRKNCSLIVLLAAATSFAGLGCAGAKGVLARHDKPILTPYEVGRLAEQEGELPAARENYAKICEAEPGNAAAQHRLAVVLTRMGELEAALPHFQAAHELDPKNADILADLGYNAYLQGEYETAENILRLALGIDSRHVRSTNNLAIVVGRTGRTRESFELFRTFQSEAEAHANVAYLHVQRDELDDATLHYNRALTLNPKLKNAASAAVAIAQHRPATEATPTQFARADLAVPEVGTPASSAPRELVEIGRSRLDDLEATPMRELADTPEPGSIILVGEERPVSENPQRVVHANTVATPEPRIEGDVTLPGKVPPTVESRPAPQPAAHATDEVVEPDTEWHGHNATTPRTGSLAAPTGIPETSRRTAAIDLTSAESRSPAGEWRDPFRVRRKVSR